MLAAALAANIFAQSEATGTVVAVVQGDAMTTLGFGRVAPLDPSPPDGHTLVRLQSVSKLLAADLLSAMVAKGDVTLADPLARFAPPGWSPTKALADAPIALVNLATHTSGLPREAIPPGLPADAATAARWGWLAQQTALPHPGRGAQYSNVAFDFLGDALSAARKTSYGLLLGQEVTGPDWMRDTTASPTVEECARLMTSDPRRPRHPCVDQSGEAASGGLYSTADDMALWLRAQLAPGADRDRRRISQAVFARRKELAYVGGLDHAGRATGVGLGWIEQDADAGHPRILEKTGGGDGFLSYVVIDPERRVGVFVAFNNVSGHRLESVADAADALTAELGAEISTPR
jgi:D-alanyl-D-alanine-carboxypeptidase/D-alanyl-D-alanine-endopeptidase